MFDRLGSQLLEITPSERWHLDHPGQLSNRYQQIPRAHVAGQDLFVFNFDKALGEHDIHLMKEARFALIPPHTHGVIELNYVYTGSCTQVIDGAEVRLRAGDFCLFDCNTPHMVEPLCEDDIVITIDMRKSYLTDHLLRHLSSRGLVTTFLAKSLAQNVRSRRHIIFHGQDERIHLLMQQLISDYLEQGDERSDEVMNAYMIILFARLVQVYGEQGGEDAEEIDDAFVQILQAIDRDANIKLGELARAFGYNETYLGVLIKQKTGQTFRAITARKRMDAACLRLTATEEPVYEIARDIGYRNLGFFYRKFRESFGCTPQEYRDARRAM